MSETVATGDTGGVDGLLAAIRRLGDERARWEADFHEKARAYAAVYGELTDAKNKIEALHSAVDAAWGILANAFGGNWDQASPEWRQAAERWRDEHILRRRPTGTVLTSKGAGQIRTVPTDTKSGT
jgi:hypothetical protein